jgi:hypothetical protein
MSALKEKPPGANLSGSKTIQKLRRRYRCLKLLQHPAEAGQWMALANNWRIKSEKLEFKAVEALLNSPKKPAKRKIHQVANSVRCQIELKPQMGDDSIAVLRQRKRNGAMLLVIGSFESISCTLEQVQGIFGERKIITLDQSEAIKNRGVWPL